MSASTLGKNLNASCWFGPHRSVTDWIFFVVCAVAVPVSLLSFAVIEARIHANSSKQDETVNLQIFDVRNGYTPEEVFATLNAWGSQGKFLYLIIEFIDCAVYTLAYRGVFLVLLNRMSAQISSRWAMIAPVVSIMPAIPLFLSWVDLLEDLGQVAMLLTLPAAASSAPWSLLVRTASAINLTKWTIVRAGTPLFLAELLLLLLL
eukprot:CAMPEP_0172168040 /NCGR_PEP_ID=MMETSP1050-20130122/9911_1 /TAXON_ID=233186 /ORGANISM="Cryptomonas curvata, Strain CCAP979/52" /LENGTH=204 /DNA_ID=CAMNT_0012838907 /DNA_START=9 /DNA_END=620 /DNA_ORIENTATION=-